MKPIIILVLLYVSITSAQTVPNLPEPRCSGVAEVVNDTLYFFGGANRHYLGSTRYRDVYKFDGNNWIVYDSIPDDNTLGMESVVVGTDVYLFSGYRFGQRVVRKYDVTNKTWSYLNLSPDLTTFGSTFAYSNNHIYLFRRSGSVYEYDLTSDTWIEKSSNIVPGFSLTSEVYQNEIYIIGYYDITFSHPFYKYNPVTDTWTELANLPYQVVKCAMEVIGDKIYCVGGSNQGSPPNQFDTLLVYDILTDTWSIDMFELSSRRVWMADVTYNNKFLVLGGIDSTNNAVVIVEEINPEGTIPVELISFKASVQNNVVYLNWSTATETNNLGFEVEKLFGEEWKVIGFVKGNGTTIKTKFYSFNDNDLQSGKYSYRLKQIDFDGTFEYSNEIEVEVRIPELFSLHQNYPNPFNPTTKLSFVIGHSSLVTLKVYDVLGNEVATLVDEYKPAGEYEVEFNTSSIKHQPSSGIYFYQLRAGDLIQTKKMILLK